MAAYHATIRWRRGEQPFSDGRYSRLHEIVLDGLTIPGSSAPSVVPLPLSTEAAMDPEEAFIASLSSCHMLWFLDVAARAGFVVASYDDEAEGTLAEGPTGKQVMTRVVLRPKIVFAGERQPSAKELADLHHTAHEECFIANSVRSEIVIEPR